MGPTRRCGCTWWATLLVLCSSRVGPIRELRRMHSHRRERQRPQRRGRALRRATTSAVRLRAFALLAESCHHLAIAEHLRLSHRRRLSDPAAGRHHVQGRRAARLRLLRRLRGPILEGHQLAANFLPL